MVDTVRDHWWWRPGWRLGRRAYTFHITFEDGTVEGGPDLRQLTAAYQASLAGMPGLDLVPLQWLHLTMQNVGFTDEVSENDVQAVADVCVMPTSTLNQVQTEPLDRHNDLLLAPWSPSGRVGCQGRRCSP